MRALADELRVVVGIDAGDRVLEALRLTVRLQINAERRRYDAREAEHLWELFGPQEQWGRSLGPVAWTKMRLDIGRFAGATTGELCVPCTFEAHAAAGKYLAALTEGIVPLELLFSGTMSWIAPGGRTQTAMVPWDRDASFRMPLAVWRQACGQARRGQA